MFFLKDIFGKVTGALIVFISVLGGFKYLKHRYIQKGKEEAETEASQELLKKLIEYKEAENEFKAEVSDPVIIDDSVLWGFEAVNGRD